MSFRAARGGASVAVSVAALLLCVQPLLALENGAAPESPASVPGIKLPSVDAPKPADAAQDAPPMKVIPDNFADAVGTWDLSLDGSNNRCQVVLSSENSKNGRVVRFPAGCRRALPPLAHTVGWLFADGGIRLVDKDIRPLLKFAPRKDRSSLIATAESGKVYSLVPLQTIAMLPPAPEVAASDPKTATLAAGPNPDAAATAALRSAEPDIVPHKIDNPVGAIPGSQPMLPSGTLVPSANAAPETPKPEKAVATTSGSGGPAPSPGVYALDRFTDKDVCRLELEPSRVAAKAGAEGLSAARILPGCHDSGIAVFDPVSWRYANGHMTLKAKRGHAINLVPTGEGGWRRDPDVGTTFVLRKVER